MTNLRDLKGVGTVEDSAISMLMDGLTTKEFSLLLDRVGGTEIKIPIKYDERSATCARLGEDLAPKVIDVVGGLWFSVPLPHTKRDRNLSRDRQIIEMAKNGALGSAISRQFGITQRSVRRILSREGATDTKYATSLAFRLPASLVVRLETILDLVKHGDVSLPLAARRLKLSIEQTETYLKEFRKTGRINPKRSKQLA